MQENVSLTVEEILTNAQLFGGDSADAQTGVMVAFFLDPLTAAQLAKIDGVATRAADLHLTLAFLGSREALTDVQIAAAILATQQVARMRGPLAGTINGIGRFNATPSSDGQDVIYAVVDVPGLAEFRQTLTSILADRNAPVSRTHDFTPHITLAYVSAGEPSPVPSVPTIPLRFSGISIVVGGRRVDFPLMGEFSPRNNAQEVEAVNDDETATPEAPNADPAPVDEAVSANATESSPEAESTAEVVETGTGERFTTDQLVNAEGEVIGGTIDFRLNASLVRSVTKNGREYLVAPTIAIKEGVLNGEYVPADEINKFALAWNGRPVPLGHPKDDFGHISANTPDLWDQTPAYFWNAQAQDGTLKGEIWFDVAKAHQIGGLAVQAEAALRQSKPLEISTAYFRDLEAKGGVYNNRSYRGIARNLRPDHIALLMDEPGACSWADGCGAVRVNSTADEAATSGSFISAIVRSVINSVKPETKKGNTVKRDQLIETLVANSACKCSKAQLEAMDDNALQAVHDSIPAPVVNTEAAPEPVVVEKIVEVEKAVPTPLPAEVTEFAKMIQDMGGIEVLQNAFGTVVTNSNRERTDLVARLVANKANVLAEADLNLLPIESLRKLATSLAPKNYLGNGGAIVGNAFDADDEFEVMAMPTVKGAN